MTDTRMDGRKVLVVGASAGIGRAAARAAVAAGADVVLAARRAERLADAVAEAGGGVAVVGDTCAPGDCARIVEEAVGHVGPLDLVIYSAGAAPLRALADTTREDWEGVLATNVVGANELIRAAVPAMAPAGVLAALSSEAAGTPRYGLGAYGASKAALEASLRGWRNEHPGLRFATVVVGQTFPTEFGDGFSQEALAAAFEHWGRHGLLQTEFMTPEGVADVLVASLAHALDHPSVGVETLVLRSPSGVVAPEPTPAPAEAGAPADAEARPRPSEMPVGTAPPWAEPRR